MFIICSSPVPVYLASELHPLFSMNKANFGSNNLSASTTDCFLDPTNAGYVSPELESFKASVYLCNSSLSAPSFLVWLAIH